MSIVSPFQKSIIPIEYVEGLDTIRQKEGFLTQQMGFSKKSARYFLSGGMPNGDGESDLDIDRDDQNLNNLKELNNTLDSLILKSKLDRIKL